jgi:hypothetical protein
MIYSYLLINSYSCFASESKSSSTGEVSLLRFLNLVCVDSGDFKIDAEMDSPWKTAEIWVYALSIMISLGRYS